MIKASQGHAAQIHIYEFSPGAKRMTGLSTVLIGVCCIFWVTICQADSIVITYGSGKTQTIPLDDSIQSISSLQYLHDQEPRKNNAAIPEIKPSPDAQTTEKPGLKPGVKGVPAANGKVKFRWADPLVEE
jgi:hypothetical protein